MLNLNKCTKN